MSQSLQEDNFADDFSTDAVNISHEISSDEFEQGASIGFDDTDMKEQEARLSEDSTQIRKTAQALFALEESLLDQHISNIKVSNWIGVFSFITGIELSSDLPMILLTCDRKMLIC